jgi:hypothetical protein
MKKGILFLVVGLLLNPNLYAQQDMAVENTDTSSQPVSLSPWYLGIGLGVNAPVQDWDPNFTLGGGGVLFGGVRLNSLMGLQLDINPWVFTGGGNSIYDYRVFLNLRFNFQGPGVSTYLFGGPGYDVQVDNPTSYSTSSVAGNVGLGFQFDIHPGEHIFIEGRYDILFYQNLTQEDIPVLFGLCEDL